LDVYMQHARRKRAGGSRRPARGRGTHAAVCAELVSASEGVLGDVHRGVHGRVRVDADCEVAEVGLDLVAGVDLLRGGEDEGARAPEALDLGRDLGAGAPKRTRAGRAL